MQRLTTPRDLGPKAQAYHRSQSAESRQGAAGRGSVRHRREAAEWTEARSEINSWLRQR